MRTTYAKRGTPRLFLFRMRAYAGDECVIWPFGKSKRGYGEACIFGKRREALGWMCILAHGEPPTARHQAAHFCGAPSCVNPRHLRWATHTENQADRAVHGTTNR